MTASPIIAPADFGPVTDKMLAELGRIARRAKDGEAHSDAEVLVLLQAMPDLIRELADWRQTGINLVNRLQSGEVLSFPRLVE